MNYIINLKHKNYKEAIILYSKLEDEFCFLNRDYIFNPKSVYIINKVINETNVDIPFIENEMFTLGFITDWCRINNYILIKKNKY